MKSTELLQSDVQVRQVAYQLGYENYETFSRAFKKLMEIPGLSRNRTEIPID